MVHTTLAHVIDVEFLREAYRRTRRDGAPGMDGQTAEEYAKDLERNLAELLERFKSGTYWAPPVRRAYVPKGDSGKRPIGIPTFEDKVLQRAVAMVLEAIYEQDFLDCSWGFRPGRSAHQALEALWKGLTEMKGGWVLEADIQGFFDNLVPGHLRSFLDQRVRDGVLRRTIDKWLKAGVLEDGQVRKTELGTPQGGVISPILANIYLHEVLDTWFEDVVKPRMKGKCLLVRYADDFVMVFELEQDARTVFEVLPKRLGRYGLTLHPEKTRLIPFQRPRNPYEPKGPEGPEPGTFDLLGFTHYWDRSRKGFWVVKRRTAASRLTRAVRTIKAWCRKHRHDNVAEQHRNLSLKVKGHNAYYGITGNWEALKRFKDAVEETWRKWLNRRSQKARMWWPKFKRLLERYPLPTPVVVHSIYRSQRSRNPRSRMR
ncbi:MAG: group II intron reverse transcriptase/maturase [Gammaproteobacteria bacterium]|nr:group II intron reverse transcriptase/maturase [Gammaproteobacteria bacterium]